MAALDNAPFGETFLIVLHALVGGLLDASGPIA
jgi:hypothetical protein